MAKKSRYITPHYCISVYCKIVFIWITCWRLCLYKSFIFNACFYRIKLLHLKFSFNEKLLRIAVPTFKVVFISTVAVAFSHRMNKYSKKGKGRGRHFLHQIDPCRTVPCQYHAWGMPGRRAGSPIAVYAWVKCRKPKTGPQKAQFYCIDEIHCRSGYNLSMLSAHLILQRIGKEIMEINTWPRRPARHHSTAVHNACSYICSLFIVHRPPPPLPI